MNLDNSILRLIIDSIGEGVVVASSDGKFLLFNPMAERIVGLGAVDEPPDRWSEMYGLFRPDQVTPMLPDEIPLARALQGDPTDEVEIFVRNARVPDGIFLSVTGRPICDEKGEIQGGVVVFRDISQRIRGAESFQQDAGRVLFELAKKDQPDLQSSIRSLAEADARKLKVERVSVWMFTSDHGEIRCEDLFRLTEGTHESGEVLRQSDYPRYFQALEENRVIDARLAAMDPRTDEFAKDYLKQLGIVSMMDVPIRLHGRVAGVVCHEHVGAPRRWTLEEQEFAASIADLISLAIEAAERRRVEAELDKNLSLLSATLESTADGILVVDRSGRIVSYNQKFLQMWRVPPALVATGDDDLVIAHVLEQLNDPKAFLRKVKEIYESKLEADTFDVLEFKDGRIFERYSQPQFVSGEAVGRVWSFRDVTDQRKAERDLRAAYEELKKLNQIKTTFASMISHELKTPLASIQESVSVVLDGLDGPLNAEQGKTLEIAKLNAEWLGRLINNFLTFTKAESGTMEMRFERQDARTLVEDAARLMRRVADKKGLAFVVTLPGAPVEVQWDKDKMKTVLLNLMDNAIKFTERGRVEVRLDLRGDDVSFVVEDTGIGIRDEDRAKIFDLFAQAVSRGPMRTGGFGIGLSICKYMAECHSGSLSVESAAGKGSRFTVDLPRNPGR